MDQGFGGPMIVGDFNSDLRSDLAVTAPRSSAAVPEGGWLAVASGGARFPGPRIPLAPSQVYEHANWGSVLSVGDYNGDGFTDLAVGYPASNAAGPQSGAIWLFDGGSSGVGAVSRPIGPAAQNGYRMGAALSSGDFSGDGVTDLAVGIPGARVAGEGSAGRVALMPGLTGSGPVTTGSLDVDRSIEGAPGQPVSQEELGSALTSGDFDGDGKDDLAIGVPSADAGGVRGSGSVLVVYMAIDAESGDLKTGACDEFSRASENVPGDPERMSGFGSVLAAADFDRDGFDDLVIGSPGASVGTVRSAGELVVRYGSAAGLSSERTLIINQDTPLVPGAARARDGFGNALAVGDVDGDSYPDLVVGTPDDYTGSRIGVGQVVLIYGGPDGLRPRVSMEIAPGMLPVGLSAANRQAFGSALAVADLNGDAAMDIAIGVPGQASGGLAGAGALTVAWGFDLELPGVPTATPIPPTSTPPPTITSTPPPTGTPRPLQYVYLPYAARLAIHDRWPTPVPP